MEVVTCTVSFFTIISEIILAECGPVLIYQISSTCTRVLVDIKGSIPKDVKDYLKHNIYPQLPG